MSVLIIYIVSGFGYLFCFSRYKHIKIQRPTRTHLNFFCEKLRKKNPVLYCKPEFLSSMRMWHKFYMSAPKTAALYSIVGRLFDTCCSEFDILVWSLYWKLMSMNVRTVVSTQVLQCEGCITVHYPTSNRVSVAWLTKLSQLFPFCFLF